MTKAELSRSQPQEGGRGILPRAELFQPRSTPRAGAASCRAGARSEAEDGAESFTPRTPGEKSRFLSVCSWKPIGVNHSEIYLIRFKTDLACYASLLVVIRAEGEDSLIILIINSFMRFSLPSYSNAFSGHVRDIRRTP